MLFSGGAFALAVSFGIKGRFLENDDFLRLLWISDVVMGCSDGKGDGGDILVQFSQNLIFG